MLSTKIPVRYGLMRAYYRRRYRKLGKLPKIDCQSICDSQCCRNERIPVTFFDIVSMSMASGKPATEIRPHVDVNISYALETKKTYQLNRPFGEITLEMKKPCVFLSDGGCDVHTGRPSVCATFPFLQEDDKGYPCDGLFRDWRDQYPDDCCYKLSMQHMLECIYSNLYFFGLHPPLNVVTESGCAENGIDIDKFRNDGKLDETRLCHALWERNGLYDHVDERFRQMDDMDNLQVVFADFRDRIAVLMSFPFGSRRTLYKLTEGGVVIPESIPEHL